MLDAKHTAALLASHMEQSRNLSAIAWRYRVLLEENGIEVPDDLGAMEMYLASMRVVSVAADLLMAVQGLRDVYGSGMELVEVARWRD